MSYFSVTATRPGVGDVPSQDVISVKLAKDQCRIEATEPDLTTTGLIEGIKSLAGNCRRLPKWLMPLFRTSATVRAGPTSTEAPISFILAALGLAFGVVFGVGAVQHLVHAHGTPWAPWPASISVSIPLLVLAAALSLGLARARTLLFTATRQEAPTFWQRKRSDIAINVIVGAVLYLLGLLTAHL